MKSIEQLLFKTREIKEETNEDADTESSDHKTKKFENQVIRKEKSDLYQMYVSNPIVFNTVNKYVQILMSPGFKFVAEDKESEDFFTNFYEGIGETGSETDQYDLMSDTLKHQFVGGEGWQENIYNKTGTRIVDLDIINPLSMDYARDSAGRVAMDLKTNNPIGFIQSAPTDIDVEHLRKFAAPDGVSLNHNQVYLPPSRVTHFKLYKVGDGFSGLGIVEPIFNSSIRKLNSEKGFAESAAKLGSPIITAEIGDSLHEPTPQQIKNTLDEISKVNQKSAFAHPYTTKLKLLEPRKPEKLREYLDYFEAVETTGMGMPAAFASGIGEATNRSTLARQEYILKISLKEIIRRTTRTIEQKQLKVMAKQYKLKEVPKIVWGEIAIEELDSKAKRLTNYINAGILTRTPGLENLIRQMENIPKLEEL